MALIIIHIFNIFIFDFLLSYLLFCLVQRAIFSSEFGETVTIIKRETNDDCLGDGVGGVSTTMALGINSISNNIFGNNNELLDCVVCGDRATGKCKINLKSFVFIFFVLYQVNITEQYHVMVVKVFSDEVFEKILYMNVVIKIIVPLTKINVINVVIVDGSMFI